jgi:hypothetical protein
VIAGGQALAVGSGASLRGLFVPQRVAERPAQAVTTTAAHVRGPLALSVDGRTWVLPIVTGVFPGRQFQVPLPSKNQALQLQRILA